MTSRQVLAYNYIVYTRDEQTQRVVTLTSCKLTHTHTHTHPFNGPFSGTTRVSRYQKGKTSLDFTEARDSEWQCGISWAVCKSAPCCRHITTPATHHSVFLPTGCPSSRRTNSVKALKGFDFVYYTLYYLLPYSRADALRTADRQTGRQTAATAPASVEMASNGLESRGAQRLAVVGSQSVSNVTRAIPSQPISLYLTLSLSVCVSV